MNAIFRRRRRLFNAWNSTSAPAEEGEPSFLLINSTDYLLINDTDKLILNLS